MKLYIANGTYVGTQAEAKAIEKTFTTVEVPTDKTGLIDYLNRTQVDADKHQQYVEDEFTSVYERQDPIIERIPAPAIETSVALDEAFMVAPLGQQLTLAEIAIGNAFQRIGRENQPAKAPQGYKGTGLREPVDNFPPAPEPADDDELFS